MLLSKILPSQKIPDKMCRTTLLRTLLSITGFILILLAPGFVCSQDLELSQQEMEAAFQIINKAQQSIIEKNINDRVMQDVIVAQKIVEMPLRNEFAIKMIPIMRSRMKNKIKPQMVKAMRQRVLQRSREGLLP